MPKTWCPVLRCHRRRLLGGCGPVVDTLAAVAADVAVAVAAAGEGRTPRAVGQDESGARQAGRRVLQVVGVGSAGTRSAGRHRRLVATTVPWCGSGSHCRVCFLRQRQPPQGGGSAPGSDHAIGGHASHGQRGGAGAAAGDGAAGKRRRGAAGRAAACGPPRLQQATGEAAGGLKGHAAAWGWRVWPVRTEVGELWSPCR
mmetsp:Transcript_68933/g.223437  ORF Transcript_68933/g.223437 Transcript_68933/m.223437 type:complete len:200 (-) Transcript_68933:43-642(-)